MVNNLFCHVRPVATPTMYAFVRTHVESRAGRVSDGFFASIIISRSFVGESVDYYPSLTLPARLGKD